jgi:AcrR family transcriptional regulator
VATGTRRTYNPEQTRAAIIDAGLKLFETVGYHGASVEEIASAARITKGAFYYHFESKEELLQLIHDEYTSYYLPMVEKALASTDDPGRQLCNLIEGMVEGVAQYRSHCVVFFQERRHLSKRRLDKIRRTRDQMQGAVLDVLKRGIQSGAFRRDIDPIATCLGIIGMCSWTYQWFSPEGRLTPKELAAEFSKMVLKGIEP